MISTLRQINNKIATHQLRLGTGRRINNAGDDPAGMTIAMKLDYTNRQLQAVYDNIGEARNMLTVAEGGLRKINDILVEMNAKIEHAASDSVGTVERQAISAQLVQLKSEIDQIAADTKFNGVQLLNSSTTFTFQTGETSQTTYTTAQYTVSSLNMTSMNAITAGTVINSSNYLSYLDEVTLAVNTVSSGLSSLGGLVNRLSIKEEVIAVTQANTEAAFSRIMDADMALEQLNLTKFQILQQTTTAMLAQANLNSQGILSLFR
jgi:flagellin